MQITITTTTETRTLEMPTTWNDLITENEDGQRDCSRAMTLLSVLQLAGGTLMEKKLACLKFLLGLTPEFIEEWKLDRAIEHGHDWQVVFYSEIEQLLACTDFLLEPVPSNNEQPATNNYQLNPTLTKCPLPVLGGMPAFSSKRRGQPLTGDLHAPADGLENITAYEMALLFDLYEQYAKTKDKGTAARLIAILYRPAKSPNAHNIEENYQGDIRRPYVEATVPVRHAHIAKLPPMVINIIFFWFLSCRLAIINEYPGIFKEGDNRERQGGDYGWWGVFRHVAGSLKDMDSIANLNYREVLSELAFLEDERMKAEMRKLETA